MEASSSGLGCTDQNVKQGNRTVPESMLVAVREGGWKAIPEFNFHCIHYSFFQGYKLCILDYDFMILNNAFLIHRSGIKTAKSSSSHIDKGKVAAQNDFIKKIIMPELKQLYGTKKGCEK